MHGICTELKKRCKKRILNWAINLTESQKGIMHRIDKAEQSVEKKIYRKWNFNAPYFYFRVK